MKILFRATIVFLLIFSAVKLTAVISIPDNFSTLSPNEQIEALLMLSEKYSLQNPDTAIYFCNKAVEIEESEFAGGSALSAKLLADAYYYKNSFQSAIKYYLISANAEKGQRSGNSNKYALRINDVGYCYYMMGYYEMTIVYYDQALEIFRRVNNEEEIYATLNNIGTVYFHRGQYEKAINYYEQTLQFDLKQGNNENLSVTYNNIGKVYNSWEKYKLAIEYFTLSLEYAKKTNKADFEAVKYSNLGMAYYGLGEFDTALGYVDKALKLDQKADNKLKIAIRESEISRIFAATGLTTKAIEHSLSALTFFRATNILESQSIVLKNLGDFYKQLGSFNKSEENYLESIDIAEKIGATHQLMIASKDLSDLYEKWGKPINALNYYKKYESFNAAIFNAKKHKQLAEFEIKYQTREKEIENQLLKDENGIKQTRLIFLTAAIIGLFLIIVLMYYGIRLKSKSVLQQKIVANLKLSAKEKEKQHLEDKIFAEKHINRLQQEQYNENIEHKNQLLTNSTLSLIRKNEFLIALKNKFSESRGDMELTKKEIIDVINQNIDIDQNWKKFSYDFEQIHPGFFDVLKLRFPDLSETYFQLCAFLRINLSTKEIAQLQHVSVSAVNKNRQRLRKKLGLEAETDLSGFLKELG